MGCGQSKDDHVEERHIHIKTRRKSKKSREPKPESIALKEEQKGETQIENTQLKENEVVGNKDLTIEGLICDGISGKTEYFSPKKPNNEGKEAGLENNNRELTIDGLICDGISGKTEYYSPKKANDDVEKDKKNEEGNDNLIIEGVICDGISGKTEYFTPKKPGDDVEVVDKEVLVEEKKTGDGKTEDSKTEEVILGEKTEVSALNKPIDDVEETDIPLKEKTTETETTVHVSGYKFDSLLSWWKTREL